jgi:hypothetical protein
VSHFILDTSDNCVNGAAFADANCITNATISGGATVDLVPGSYGLSPANPNFPTTANIIGVKFNVVGGPAMPVTITFDSDRAPVYGDFYMKIANNKTAYNNGLGIEGTSLLLVTFRSRPDGQTPSRAALLRACGLSLTGSDETGSLRIGPENRPPKRLSWSTIQLECIVNAVELFFGVLLAGLFIARPVGP